MAREQNFYVLFYSLICDESSEKAATNSLLVMLLLECCGSSRVLDSGLSGGVSCSKARMVWPFSAISFSRRSQVTFRRLKSRDPKKAS